jgi:hypothetical protein
VLGCVTHGKKRRNQINRVLMGRGLLLGTQVRQVKKQTVSKWTPAAGQLPGGGKAFLTITLLFHSRPLVFALLV